MQVLEDDSPGLAQFLRHIEPVIREQLQRNLRSHAFDGKIIKRMYKYLLLIGSYPKLIIS